MKVLKWILIVVVILAGLVLIVPAFLPASSTISAEIEIALEPEEVFHSAALFSNRDQWDPWLKIEPEAEVSIVPLEGYVGSTYSWAGDKIGSGLMKVEKVSFGKMIQSSIWFGEDPDSSVVKWNLKKTDVGTHVTWNFTGEGKYPFGRLMMLMMSGGMKSSFESGLNDMKELLEADPPKLFKTGEIKVDILPEMNTLLMPAEGTSEEISGQFEYIFTTIFTHIGSNQLQVAGPPIAYYTDFDEETGISHALVGAHLQAPAESSGEMLAKTFKETKAVIVVHSGKYIYLKESYAALMQYVAENEIEVADGALEIYQKSMMESKNPMDWKTMIAFPLK